MPVTVRENERSYTIDLITFINVAIRRYTLQIKRAGGELTISSGHRRMFPDLMLYSDATKSRILQGWEIKLPDTSITDETFIKDAQKKAISLGLNSCFIWNFTAGVLYIKDECGNFRVCKQWNNTNHIHSRADVEAYRADWESTIEMILVELNQFFLSGDIASAFLGEIISDSVITSIIDRNKSIVAAELASYIATNAVAGAFLNVWWTGVSSEFSTDEKDRFNAYAKVVILNWINKIVFANLIKRHHSAANVISSINLETTPAEANVLFERISEKCDFFNVFSTLDYNVHIPRETWSDLMELNGFLIENGIEEIEQESLQNILECSVSSTKKELAGQFATPPKLAEILAKITILDPRTQCMDPCCGTGSIAKAILALKQTHFDITEAIGTTWASDKYAYPLQIANISLTSSKAMNEPIRIFKHNVLNLFYGERIDTVNPSDGELLHFELPMIGTLVSNLPFIQFENIKDDDLKLVNQIVAEVHARTGILLSGRSDLYCFIIFSLHKLLETGGRIGVIISNSWLGTAWGKEFFKALNQYFLIDQIHISGHGRWFHNAKIVTVILVLTKKETISVPLKNKQISFYKWNKPLAEVENTPGLSEMIVCSALLDKALDGDVMTLSKYNHEQIESLQRLNISLNAMFHDVMWILKIESKLIPIEKAFHIIRGERRGWDSMFYPRHGHGIESVFIKKVLKSSGGVTRLFAKADNDAFCCSYSLEELQKQGLAGALNWIQRFENGVNEKGKPLPHVLAKSNMHWYEMKDTSVADVCTTVNPGQRLFWAKFEEPTFINQRLIGLKNREPYQDIELNHALLNSIVGMFFIEAAGFGRGLGALDIRKNSVQKMPMLNPNQVSNSDRAKILNQFASICGRDVMNTPQELQQADRRKYDQVVLEAFGIDQYYEDMRSSLISIQNARLSVR